MSLFISILTLLYYFLFSIYLLLIRFIIKSFSFLLIIFPYLNYKLKFYLLIFGLNIILWYFNIKLNVFLYFLMYHLIFLFYLIRISWKNLYFSMIFLCFIIIILFLVFLVLSDFYQLNIVTIIEMYVWFCVDLFLIEFYIFIFRCA